MWCICDHSFRCRNYFASICGMSRSYIKGFCFVLFALFFFFLFVCWWLVLDTPPIWIFRAIGVCSCSAWCAWYPVVLAMADWIKHWNLTQKQPWGQACSLYTILAWELWLQNAHSMITKHALNCRPSHFPYYANILFLHLGCNHPLPLIL